MPWVEPSSPEVPSSPKGMAETAPLRLRHRNGPTSRHNGGMVRLSHLPSEPEIAEPHAGAQFNLFDPGGLRHQVFITHSSDTDITYLEARHRGHARVEDRIRCAKDTGLRNLPFPDFANNACWIELICVARDVIAFTQGLVLEGELARAEPKRLRCALVHTAGRLTTSSRRTALRLQHEWPWARALADAFATLRSLPLTT